MNRTERGSSTGELVVLVPVLMLIVLLVVHVGRVMQTAIGLQHVAEVAARDASMSSRRQALAVAIRSSKRELLRKDLDCSRMLITTKEVQVGGLQSVKVHLKCNVSQKDVGVLNLFPLTLQVSALSVIDRYRGE